MKSVALVPTLYRPEGLRRVLSSLKATAPDVDIVIAAEWDDIEAEQIALKYGAAFSICTEQMQGPAYAWNTTLFRAKDYDLYILASDDVEYEPGWYKQALHILKNDLNGSGLVGFNDGTGKYGRTGWVTQYMMTRDFIIEHNGGVAACPHYRVDFVDVEASYRAKSAHKFAYSHNSHVTHHWREADDAGYLRADKHRGEARKVFEKRKSNGFPDDYERII